VPKEDQFYNVAKSIVEYGFKGDLAIYLEEDCEIDEFINKINQY